MLALLLTLAAQAAEVARPELDEILRRHVESLGDGPALRSGALCIRGRGTTKGQQTALRALVRREPFGYREEWIPPRGQATVMVSDGRHAWTPTHALTGPVRPGTPLRGMPAISLLERAFCEGYLYLDPTWTHGRANFDARITLGSPRALPSELERDLAVHQVHFVSPAGSLLLFLFDVRDGRLLEIAQPEVEPAWFLRMGRWRRFGRAWLPSLRVAGRFDERADPDLQALEIDEVRVVPEHPAVLFLGSPEQTLPTALDGGPLRLLPDTVAGMAHAAVTGMRVGTQPGVVMLVDSGASGCAVVPRLAAAQRLLPLGRQRLVTASGQVEVRRAWIDEIVFGERRVQQLAATCIELPAIFALPPDQAPGFLLGGEPLFSGSPVLDFTAGRLWLRGAPVTELARFEAQKPPRESPGDRVATVPFALPRTGGATPDVEIEIDGKRLRALFDTGFPAPLRLSAASLTRLGLPATPQAWLERGGLTVRSAGAGGGVSSDVYAVLPEFRLGQLAFERPIVQLDFSARNPHDAIVGCGALVRCSRVGIDDERQRLELEIDESIVRGDDGVWRIPAPGIPLGVSIGSPATIGTGPHAWPEIQTVADGSPAAAAGLLAGERVVAIDGRSCEGTPAWTFNRSLWLQPGQRVELRVRNAAGDVRGVVLP